MTLPNGQTPGMTAYGRVVGGRYQVLETLGAGGMAVVYNAYDTHLERNVALKMILPSRQSTEMFLERFQVEARSLAQLSQNSIVRVLDYGDDDGVPFLVMEYIAGGTLKELTGRPIPYDQAAAILAPVARALDYVHQHNIVHQDVKPSNILLTDKDAPMLSDFGVVRLLEEETQETEIAATGVGIGTPDYMSPEQGMGRAIDFRADIYSLGVVFYELVTGQKPFTAETPMAVVIQHVTGEFPRVQASGVQLPPLIEAVIHRAVAKDPEERFEDMGRFAEALEEIALGEKMSEKALKRLLKRRPTQQQQKRRKAVRGVMFTLVLFLALIGLGSAAWFTSLVERINLFTIQGTEPAAVAQAAPTEAARTEAAPTGTAAPSVTATQEPTVAPTPKATSAGMNPKPSVTPTSALSLLPTPRPTSRSSANGELFFTSDVALIDQRLPEDGEDFGDVSLLGVWGIGAAQQLLYDQAGERIFHATSQGVFVYSSKDLSRQHFIPTRSWVRLIALTPDGKTLWIGLKNGVVLAYDSKSYFEDAVIEYEAPSSERLAKEPAAPVQAFGFSRDMTYMAVGYENGTLRVYNMAGMEQIFIWDQYRSVSGLYFSEDNRYLYSAKDDAVINVWDLFSGKVDRTITLQSPVSDLRVSTDGQWLWAAGEGGILSIISLMDDRILFNYPSNGKPITAMAVSPDQKTVVVGLQNGEIVFYPYPTAEGLLKMQQATAKVKSHPDAVTSLEYAPDGKSLISSSYHEGLLVWDPNAAAQTMTLNQNRLGITRMAFTAFDNWLLVERENTTVEIWDVQKSHLLVTYEGRIPDGKFFLDNQYVVLVQDGQNWWEEGRFLVIQYPSTKLVQDLPGYLHGWFLSPSPDNKLLVMGTKNKALIWDTSIWERVEIHGGPNSGCGQFFTPENHLISIIWKKGVLFELDEKTSTLCALDANFAEVLALSPSGDRAMYRLNHNGLLWEWRLDKKSFTDQENYKTYQKQTWPDERFLGYAPEGTMYLYVKDDDQVLMRPSETKLQINDWAAFQYQGTLSSAGGRILIALGSQFGTITIYGK